MSLEDCLDFPAVRHFGKLSAGSELVEGRAAPRWAVHGSTGSPRTAREKVVSGASLELSGIHSFYGPSHVLFGVSLSVQRGEVVALLGRNGAGKTTTLRGVMGLTPPSQGSVMFHGEEIRGRPPHFIARRGIAYVPEERRIFPDLTVGENLQVAGRASTAGGWNSERVYGLFTDLKRMERRQGGHLSGGEQQMLAIARALMGNPRLLLLDEPSEGLAPMVVRRLAEQVRKLKEEGVGILLAEQNVRFALDLSDRAYVLEKGRVRFSGAASELRDHEELRRAYLGV